MIHPTLEGSVYIVFIFLTLTLLWDMAAQNHEKATVVYLRLIALTLAGLTVVLARGFTLLLDRLPAGA